MAALHHAIAGGVIDVPPMEREPFRTALADGATPPSERRRSRPDPGASMCVQVNCFLFVHKTHRFTRPWLTSGTTLARQLQDCRRLVETVLASRTKPLVDRLLQAADARRVSRDEPVSPTAARRVGRVRFPPWIYRHQHRQSARRPIWLPYGHSCGRNAQPGGSASATADQLASETGTAVPALRCLLDYLVAIGVFDRDTGSGLYRADVDANPELRRSFDAQMLSMAPPRSTILPTEGSAASRHTPFLDLEGCLVVGGPGA